MKYNRFEELPVWKDAIELAVRVFATHFQTLSQCARSAKALVDVHLKQYC